MATTGSWQSALRFSLANAIVFFLLSLIVYLSEPDSLPILLFAPTLFFLGATVSFVLLIRNGGAFAAIAWFIIGVGMYFGLGVVVGGLDPDTETVQAISSTTLNTDLMRINLMNSSSVLIVLLTAIPFSYAQSIRSQTPAADRQETIALLVKTFPLMAIVAFAALVVQFIVFPGADNLLVRIFLSYFSVIIPFCILALGMLWTRLPAIWVIFGVAVFLLALCLGLLSMSKYATMSALIPLVAGMWVHRHSVFSVILGLFLLGASYAFLGGITDAGRAHPDYDADKNSPVMRFEILIDILFPDAYDAPIEPVFRGNSVSGGGAGVPKGFTRLSITAVQGFLIDQYEHNNPGTSLNDFWAAAIPRVFWPDKPIVTRFGAELHNEFWGTSDVESALAPTYSGEAYWNGGTGGLVIVSLLLGLEVGWMTRRWQIAASGADPAFFLIAFPVALWGAYVESWIAASYIGGFITFVIIWQATRFILHNFFGVAQQSLPLE